MCGGTIHNTAHLNGISRSCAIKWPCSGPETWVWNLQYRVGNNYRSLRNNGMLKGLRAQWERLSENGLKYTTSIDFPVSTRGTFETKWEWERHDSCHCPSAGLIISYRAQMRVSFLDSLLPTWPLSSYSDFYPSHWSDSSNIQTWPRCFPT